MTRLVDTNIIKKNKLKPSMDPPFFDAKNPPRKYSELNNVSVPGPKEIREYQLQKISMFQKATMAKLEQKYKGINELFLSGAVNVMEVDGAEMHIDKVISNIVGNINTIWNNYTKSGETSEEKKYAKISENIKKLEKTLTTLQSQLSVKSVVYTKILDEVRLAMNNCEIGSSLSREKVSAWIFRLNQTKGAVVEEIATAWLRKRIPELNTITTGSLELQNLDPKNKNWKGTHGASKGQLIQDILTLYIEDVDLMRTISITYRINGEVKKNIPLGDFLKEMESHTGSSHIAIDNEGYDTLLNLSQLNIQAKAGFYQLPWNEKSKNTHIKISDFIDEKPSPLGPKAIFKMLHNLDNEEETKDWLYDTHDSYDAIANYGLATVLYKTLHLSEYGNQMVITPLGFTPFTKRLEFLLQKETSYISIATRVHVNATTLDNSYRINLVK